MKNIFLLLFFIFSIYFIFSDELTQPTNNLLFTEFKFTKTANYLKNPIKGNGYIAMNGKNYFIYKQTFPILIEVRKNENKLTLKIKDNVPIELNSNSNGDSIAFLFDDPKILSENYDVKKTSLGNKDQYLIIPKKIEKIEKIIVIGIDDKFESIKIYFKDKSIILYEFFNTKTGIKPDPKYF